MDDGVNPHTFDGLLMDFYGYQQMLAKFGIIASVCNMLTSCLHHASNVHICNHRFPGNGNFNG